MTIMIRTLVAHARTVVPYLPQTVVAQLSSYCLGKFILAHVNLVAVTCRWLLQTYRTIVAPQVLFGDESAHRSSAAQSIISLVL